MKASGKLRMQVIVLLYLGGVSSANSYADELGLAEIIGKIAARKRKRVG